MVKGESRCNRKYKKLLDDLPAIKRSDEQGIEKGVSEGRLGKGGK
jgi:hypothetical protein